MLNLGRIKNLRNAILKDNSTLPVIIKKDYYSFLGSNRDEKAASLSKKVLPFNAKSRYKKKHIFEYIVDFWENTTIEMPYMAKNGKGLNLARYPFLIPSLSKGGFFQEQYRWDTRFHNLGLIAVGGYDLCLFQLKNLVEVYKEYGKIPNALTTEFLSHAHPPLETTAVFDILNSGYSPGSWSDETMITAEKELFSEWLDLWEEKKHPRMSVELISRYGFLSRYANVHFHPVLVGCEDAKDHNWVSAKFGEHYIPVQLNSIIYKIVTDLIRYYEVYKPDKEKVIQFSFLRDQIYKSFQELFWIERGDVYGFYNYAIDIKNTGRYEGHILFDELAASIFPLWAGVCTPYQANKLVEKIEKVFKYQHGLVSTSKESIKEFMIVKSNLEGWEFQWEYPNMWPPLMQIAIEGLIKYGYHTQAVQYMVNWIKYIEQDFNMTGLFHEKYSVDLTTEVNGGYYGTEKGFGWTIGTYIWMLSTLSNYERNNNVYGLYYSKEIDELLQE